MIPSVQLASNSGTLSSIHNELLEKLELPITPSASPIDQTTAQTTRFSRHFNGNDIMMHHDDVLIRTMKAANFNEIVLGCVDDPNSDDANGMHNEHTICIGRDSMMNYTIVGNGVILNVIDDSEVEFDDGTNDSNNINEQIAGDIAGVTQIDEVHAMDELNKNDIRINDRCGEEHTLCREDDNLDMQSTVTAMDINNSSIPDVIKSQHIIHNECIDADDGDDSDGSSSEHELTNLGWLIDLKNLAHFPSDTNSSKRDNATKNAHALATSTISTCIIDDIDDDNGRVEPMISDKDLSVERFKKFTIQVKQSQKTYAESEAIYRIDPLEKPPFNYAQIIAMAMMDKGRMTLKDICKWIQEHFAYFRYNKNWNNSIRHNLSLHFCFTKIARDKTEKGKGGYWELSMNTMKSEKKRIRNRRKQRDESGRFAISYRSGSKRCSQKSTASHSRPSTSNSKIVTLSKPSTNDSCNVSTASDASSSICSNLTEEAINIWSDMSESHNAQQLLATAQNSIANDHLISQVIANEMIIVNGVILDQNSSDTVEYNFEQSQIVDSFFIEPHQRTSPLLRHQSCSSDSAIDKAATSPMLNDSSDEIYITSDLNHRPNSIDATTHVIPTTLTNAIITAPASTTTTMASNTSNVIVEPMPYCLSHMDTVIDIEHEFSSLVNLPDPELSDDGLFDYSTW